MAFRKSKKVSHDLWRPDFRDAESLPDVKVIRTDFLLNLVSVSLAIGLVGVLAQRELRSVSLNESIRNLSEEISQNEVANTDKIRLSGEFRRLQNGMQEFVRFQNVPVLPDGLLVELAMVQPDPIILDSVSFNGVVSKPRGGADAETGYTLMLSGTVDDSKPGMGSRVITEYRSSLRNVHALKRYFKNSELTGFSRNEALALFNFTIRIELTEEPIEDAS